MEITELFFATTGAIGANVSGLRDEIKKRLNGYSPDGEPIEIKEISIAKLMGRVPGMGDILGTVKGDNRKKYESTILHQDAGDLLRHVFKDGAILARLAIDEIMKIRRKLKKLKSK